MDSWEIFDHLSSKIGQLIYGRTLGDRNGISKILDELNALNYRYPIVKSPTKAVLLINQCCNSIHPDDDVLVPKCAQLIANLIIKQSLSVEGRTLSISIQWCLQATKNSNQKIVLDTLRALEALMRNNVQNIPILLDTITKKMQHKIVESTANKAEISQEILLAALECLEASTVVPADVECLDNFFSHFEKCAEIFISFLCAKNCPKDSVSEVKILETCLHGLQNIVLVHPGYLRKELGLILGIIKTYMLYSIKDVEFLTPEKLLPTTLSIPEITLTVIKEKTGGKVTKQRKHRSTGNHKRKEKKSHDDFDLNKSGTYLPATVSLECNSDSGVGQASALNSRLRTSDSDFSDNEGGKLAKLSHNCNRVRQASLNLFCSVIKHSEKATIFAYWSSFIPESPSSGKHNLLTCILKDPSTRAKMCALNVLLLLLSSVKMYLAQAESSEKTSSFTPFSMILGLTLIELHNSLCLALTRFLVPVLTQVLKCLAALVQATPYHRMTGGLITKIVRNVKGMVFHKDATVQVTALIAMGCILAFEPPIPETGQAMAKIQKDDHSATHGQQESNGAPKELPATAAAIVGDDFDYAQFSSDDEDDVAIAEVDSMSWLLHKCLTNLGVTFEDSGGKENDDKAVPAPVKLESLQVLSAMSRNHFESLMLPHLNHIARALELSLTDKYADLRLHAGRAVDFLGQAIGRMGDNEGLAMCLNFWQTLLNGPLVSLFQCEQHSVLRAIGCDCIGSIGPHIFQQFPRDKQILCVTLLFACAKDEENAVRGAAVRALALCVLYPSLREDPGFVVDTAESILQALKDENVNVRVKASWSLGNLSDALVLNSKSCSDSPEDAIPPKILLSLLEESIRSAGDNEKIKMNVVRAIGNLVQLVDGDLLKEDLFKDASERALNALVKASTTGTNMKVRWNACYALGNALKNSSLYSSLDANAWQSSAFTKLAELVIGFKNFKVRINAALALSSPAQRAHYGRFFVPIWTALLQALENSQNIDEFTEYKHRDHLVEQICLCLGHLTTLLTKEDLVQLESVLCLYLDTFRTHMHKVLERLVPEKSTDLFSATCALTNLEARSDITGVMEKRVIACLRTIFGPP